MRRKIHEYAGEEISIDYDAKRCIHAAECVHGLPAVFDPDRRPWVDPDGAGADSIADVVGRCPTGALRFERLDGGPAEVPPSESVVAVAPDGPLYVRGDLRLGAALGEADEEGRVDYRTALCRCGESANKPFCDNAHQERGFEDPGAVDVGRGTAFEDLEAEPGSASSGPSSAPPAGPLAVTAAPNGPLLFGGPVELRSGDGECRILVQNPALCRCGHSRDKPFCDGTHFSVGFQAD